MSYNSHASGHDTTVNPESVQDTASSHRTQPEPSGRNLSYVLPALVESVRTSWITTFQSAAVVSSLLAGVSGGLLSAINDDYDSVAQFRESIRSFLYIASFGAILLNISATMTSLVLIERLSGLQWSAAKRHWVANHGFAVNFDGVELLSVFGVHRLWRYLIWH
ncbi:hypothetical protein BDZ89DRAFT_1169938 [Hymenopellis radicata]|nr:hypothetical protein BDZ89DRAFT_1169938 [Hymenopellis radicata]